MRFFVVILLAYLCSCADAKSSKKVVKDEASAVLNKKILGKSKPITPPAIIAIEIVDPNENKTSKNSKRTIDQALGYGYQKLGYSSSYSPPKYEVYKYSQHDIPPYRGNLHSHNIFSSGIKSHHYDVQQSLSYKLPSQHQYYQPGTTLFSTINNQGQVGGLTNHLPIPETQNHYGQEPQVPVIILRVLPSQLNDPSAVLHPNLPQNHPLASAINSIDIQSLLSNYVQNLLVNDNQHQHQHQYQEAAPQDNYQYQYQDYQEEPQYQYQYQQQESSQYQHQTDDGLLTHENYPKETHTRVIFRTDKNKLPVHTETKTVQVALPASQSQAYSSVEVQTPDMQYSYTNQGDGDKASQAYYSYETQPSAAQNYYYTQTQAEPAQQNQIYQYQSQESGYTYQQPVQQQHQQEHSHQKRSRKVTVSSRDVLKLRPIKA